MPVELKMLAWSIGLGILYLLIGTTLSTMQRGLAWNASARDVDGAPLTGATGRADRAFRNLLETFVFFAAAVLAVVLAQRTNSTSALGAQLFFWARVVYWPIYIMGIPYVRTLVWTVSVVGIVMVLICLF